MPENYHHGDLRAKLIHEGLKILDKDGYNGLSLRKVAKACGVSQTAPYRHFKDKDELVSAISDEALTNFNHSLEEAVNKYKDPRKALIEMGVSYVHFFAENPEYMRLLFMNKEISNKIDGCSYEEHYISGHPFATFFNAVSRYKEAYPEEKMDCSELLLSAWGIVHGIASLLVNSALPNDEDNLRIAVKIIRSGSFCSSKPHEN